MGSLGRRIADRICYGKPPARLRVRRAVIRAEKLAALLVALVLLSAGWDDFASVMASAVGLGAIVATFVDPHLRHAFWGKGWDDGI